MSTHISFPDAACGWQCLETEEVDLDSVTSACMLIYKGLTCVGGGKIASALILTAPGSASIAFRSSN